jgi:hypothetical protein
MLSNKQLYKEFTTEEEAKKWAEENYKEWLIKIQITEYRYPSTKINNLLYGYTGNTYQIYNPMLRGFGKYDKEEIEEYTQYVDIINNEISGLSLKENIVVWRYTYKNMLKLFFENNKIKKNDIFTDKAFMDTTLIPDLLRNFAIEHRCDCLLKLYLPIGTRGAYIDFYDEHHMLNECEFLLPVNTSFILKKKYFSLRYMKMVYECYLARQE